MGNSVSGRNAAAAGLAGVSAYVSLHSADPGTTGASEISGGSPAYARKAVTWAAASGGSDVSNVILTFDIPPGTTIAYMGLWSAPTNGTYQSGGPLSASETYTAQGKYDLNTATINGN